MAVRCRIRSSDLVFHHMDPTWTGPHGMWTTVLYVYVVRQCLYSCLVQETRCPRVLSTRNADIACQHTRQRRTWPNFQRRGPQWGWGWWVWTPPQQPWDSHRIDKKLDTGADFSTCVEVGQQSCLLTYWCSVWHAHILHNDSSKRNMLGCGDLEVGLWPPNSNVGEIFVQCT